MKEIYTITEVPAAEGREAKNRWTKIGIAFVNKDGSINCFLDAYPANGKLHIRDKKEKEQGKQQDLPMPESDDAPF